MINSAEILIIKRYLKPKSKDGVLKIISLFSLIGIGLGVATLIIVMSVMNGFRSDLIDKLVSFQPHVSVENISNYSDIKKNISSVSNKSKIKIKDINLVNNSKALLISKKKNKGIVVKGYNFKEDNKNNFLKKNIIKGSFDNSKGIGIGNELASELGVNINDNITLFSSTSETTPFGFFPKQFIFKISYIFNTGLYDYDSSFVIMDINQVSNLSTNNNEIEIRLTNPEQSIDLIKNLKKKYPDLLIYSWIDSNKTFYDALKVERNVMFIILTLIIIVGAFNIISGLTILVKNKTKEIGILKSIGFSTKSIQKIFFLTGSWIGILGTVFGVIFGILFSLYIENIRVFLSNVLNIEIFPAEVYFLSKMPSHLDFSTIGIISFFSILITFIVSIIPATKAAKLDPIISLKNE